MTFRRLAMMGAVMLAVALSALAAACASPTQPPSELNLEPAAEYAGTADNSAPVADATAPLTVTGMTTDTAGVAVTGDLTGAMAVTSSVALTPTISITGTLDAGTFAAFGNNVSYTIDGRSYTLVDGVYADETARIDLHLIPLGAAGDLNGDGASDFAALLAMNTGGSGTFEYVAPVIDENGLMVGKDALFLGDRVHVRGIAIADGAIVMDVVTHGPNDPMCCPTLAQRWSFALADGKLTLTSPDGPVGTTP